MIYIFAFLQKRYKATQIGPLHSSLVNLYYTQNHWENWVDNGKCNGDSNNHSDISINNNGGSDSNSNSDSNINSKS